MSIETREPLLDRLEDPILLVDRECRILYRNVAAGRVLLAKAGLEVREGRLIAATSADEVRLAQIVAECGRLGALKQSTCRGIKLSRKGAAREWLVVVSPLHAQDSAVGIGTLVIHLVSRVHPRHLPVAALRDLFSLTRKEVDVVAGLLRRESLHDVAERLNLSHETIRAYVKRIFRKCEIRSQIELIALLQRLSLLAGPG